MIGKMDNVKIYEMHGGKNKLAYTNCVVWNWCQVAHVMVV